MCPPFDRLTGIVADCFKIDTMAQWVQAFYEEQQNAYRVFVESTFPSMKPYFATYKSGPLHYDITIYGANEEKDCFNEDAYVCVRKRKLAETDACATELRVKEVEPKSDSFDYHSSTALRVFMRQGNSIRRSGLHRHGVYGLLWDDLSTLLTDIGTGRKIRRS
jgi:hypothetical protein